LNAQTDDIPQFDVPDLAYAEVPHSGGSLRVAYRETNGGGAAIIFLHGIGSASQAWEAQLKHFGATRRAIAWDAPGYGGSADLSPEAPAAGDYADVLAGLLTALGIDSAVLVGNSLGALMAAAFVKRYPKRVQALVLSDVARGYARLNKEEQAKMAWQRIEAVERLGAVKLAQDRAGRLMGPDAPPEIAKRAELVMQRIRPKGYAQAARMLAGAEVFDELQGCTAPTQVIVGGADLVTPPAGNKAVAEAIPGARYLEIPGIGHLPYLEAADAFNTAVEDFLGGLRAAA
jgi:pimeloyl-ACP methyl ester carboxylesterase